MVKFQENSVNHRKGLKEYEKKDNRNTCRNQHAGVNFTKKGKIVIEPRPLEEIEKERAREPEWMRENVPEEQLS